MVLCRGYENNCDLIGLDGQGVMIGGAFEGSFASCAGGMLVSKSSGEGRNGRLRVGGLYID